MCGLIAFAGASDPAMIQSLADQARRRGPDSLGLAWSTVDGRWTIHRRRTQSWPEPFPVEMVSGSIAGIGHARLSTSGRPGLDDAQPLLIDGMVFAHNGTVYQHEGLAYTHGMDLDSRNDSEVMGRVFQASGYDAQATVRELESHQGRRSHAWIAGVGRKLWLASFGQPLYYRLDPMTMYACSWRFPGCVEVATGSMLVWDLQEPLGLRGVPGYPPGPRRLKM